MHGVAKRLKTIILKKKNEFIWLNNGDKNSEYKYLQYKYTRNTNTSLKYHEKIGLFFKLQQITLL